MKTAAEERLGPHILSQSARRMRTKERVARYRFDGLVTTPMLAGGLAYLSR